VVWKALSWPIWLAAIALCAIVMMLLSLDWPLANHAPMRLYVAREILSGAAPYRDIVDLHTPGTNLIHMLELLTFGFGDLPYRVFDLLYLALIDLGAAEIAYVAGWPGAVLAASLITIMHLANGTKAAGDTDFLLVLPLMISAACFLAAAQSQRRTMLFAAGLAAGFAVIVKISAIAFPFFLLAILVWTFARAGLGSALTAFIAGALMAPAGVLAWLSYVDGLDAYLIAAGPLSSFYDTVERLSLAWEVIRLARDGLPMALPFVPVAILLVLALWLARNHLPLLPMLLSAVGMATGLVIVAIFPKDLEFGLYTLIDFTLLLASLCCGALLASGQRGRRAAGIGLLIVALVTLPMLAQRYRAEAAAWPANSVSAALVGDLRELVPADAQVQVLDDMLGGIDALLRLNKTQPTGFPYDYPLFMRVGSPQTTQFRTRFLSEMAQMPPAAIVVTNIPWWNYENFTPGYSRLATWPELEALLARDYALAVERGGFAYLRHTGYRLYVRKAAP
jgi:hypothetical protein